MKRNVLLTSTFFVTNLVYFFAISSWISIQSVSHLIERWSHHSEMTVYLKQDVKPGDIEHIKGVFKTFSDQATAFFQSSDDIRKSLKKLMPKSNLDFADTDDLVAAIPPHFIVKGSSIFFGESLFELFKTISNEVSKSPFVDSTSYGKSWAEKYSAVLESFRGATIFFLVGLGFALILVIGNTIRSHINSQREEIEILELVGATPGMIRKPFLIEGTLLSIASMTFALCIATFIIYILKSTSGELATILDFETSLWQLSSIEWSLAITLSAIIGFLGSYFCLTEINTGWAASGHKNKINAFLELFRKQGLKSNG